MALDDVTQRILDDTKLKMMHFLPFFGLNNYRRVIDFALVDVNETLRKKLEKRRSILELYNWGVVAALGCSVIYVAYLRTQYGN